MSDDEIKEGDWIYSRISKSVFQYFARETSKDREFHSKIIATTDESLKIEGKCWCMKPEKGGCLECNKSLPQPSQSFIEKYVESYNKGQQIIDVLVEYEEWNKAPHIKDLESELWYEPKINPKDNTITIKKVKDSWSREEIKQLILQFGKNNPLLRGCQITNLEVDKWIEQNL